MTVARWLDLTPGQYHALRDDALTQSLAVELLQKSPRHARRKQIARAQPATPHSEEAAEKRRAMDFGTLMHSELLGGLDDRIAVEPFADWRTKAAKERKAEIRAAGRIPVLQKDHERAQRLAERARAELARYEIDLSEERGVRVCERAIEWHEGDLPARGMFDAIDLPAALVYDLKMTGDAHPERFRRSVERMGYDVQAGAYVRALELLYPRLAGRVRFRWILIEGSGEVVICEATPGMLHLGTQKWLRACRAWGQCLSTDRWPGYGGGRIIPVEPSEWAIADEMRRSHEQTERSFAAMAAPRGAESPAEPPEEEDDDSPDRDPEGVF